MLHWGQVADSTVRKAFPLTHRTAPRYDPTGNRTQPTNFGARAEPTVPLSPVVLRRVPLGSLRKECLIPGRKFVPRRNWGGESADEKPEVFIVCLFNA